MLRCYFWISWCASWHNRTHLSTYLQYNQGDTTQHLKYCQVDLHSSDTVTINKKLIETLCSMALTMIINSVTQAFLQVILGSDLRNV